MVPAQDADRVGLVEKAVGLVICYHIFKVCRALCPCVTQDASKIYANGRAHSLGKDQPQHCNKQS